MKTTMHPIGQTNLLVYPHFGIDFVHKTAVVRDVRRWLPGGAGKGVNDVFPGRPRSFWYQRRPVDECSPGQGTNAQDSV